MNHVKFSSLLTLVFVLLISLASNAKTNMGEITIEIGRTRTVDVGYGSSGHWTKSNSTFIFVSQGQTSCEIKGNQVGTGTLEYFGVVGGSDFELYWTVNVVSVDFPQLSADPPGGEIEKGTTVMLYANGKGAEWSYDIIQYTLDGKDPKWAANNRYTYQGIVINESCTLRAIGMKWNQNTSTYDYGNELVETYTIKLPKLTLKASPYNILPEPVDAGTKMYLSTPNVTGADIYYTLDGTEPSKSSIKYTSSGITINEFCIVNAIAYKDGYETSSIGTWRYGINQQDISIDATNFPDENFRNYLLGLSIGKDGVITAKEIINSAIKSPYNKNIGNLKGIEFFALLTDLSCSQNNLTSIDLRSNRYLERLQCFMNNLSSIDLSKNKILISLICSWNSLTSLDVSKNTKLINLDCYNNQLSYLDVSNNVVLTTLQCSHNQLTSLDVSNNASLKSLDCSNNKLSSLIVPNSADLMTITCSKNYIKDTAMDALINSLPINTSGEKHYFRVINNQGNAIDNNVCTKTQVASAKTKGWTPQYWSGSEWLDYEGSDNVVLVTEIILNKSSLSLQTGQSETLTATVKPDNATDKSVTWKSSNTSVADVNNGKVTAIAKGTAKITCTANDGSGKYATCTVTVTDPIIKVTSITLNKTSITLEVEKSETLTATVKPDNATNKTVTWSSEEESVATVDNNGKVTAIAKGTAKITCTANDGSGVAAECAVTVTVPKPDKIVLPDEATVTAGASITLTPEVTPANAEYTLMWTSKDETIATVDENGVVTGVKKGQTFIIVETDNGKKAYCMLTVTAQVPIRIELPEEATIYVGQTITLTPTITPKDAETTLIWTSNKPSVASVDANGVLTGKAEGLALVTVSTSNGLTSDPCMVKVELDPSGISTVIMDGKADVPIYTPSGQRLAAPRKGINIVGGKKVIVK